MTELAHAYDAGFVHADMSEYNVFISPAGVTVFDWPQAVSTEHENAREFLRRDVQNVIGYLQRKYPAEVPDVEATDVLNRIESCDFESVTAVR
jgi:RIO kinase 2